MESVNDTQGKHKHILLLLQNAKEGPKLSDLISTVVIMHITSISALLYLMPRCSICMGMEGIKQRGDFINTFNKHSWVGC